MPEKTVDLNKLEQLCKLSPARCAFFAEAACVCLEKFGHEPGVQLSVKGSCQETVTLIWKKLEPDVQLSWLRFDKTAQEAARALAILCIEKLTTYQVIGKAAKVDGFDFWLDEKQALPPFQPKGKLEVSGIFQGSKGQINFRMNKKIQKVRKGIYQNLPAYVVVSEFSRPFVNMIQL